MITLAQIERAEKIEQRFQAVEGLMVKIRERYLAKLASVGVGPDPKKWTPEQAEKIHAIMQEGL